VKHAWTIRAAMRATYLVSVAAVSLAARPAAAEKMTFAWPLPAKVTVTDKSTRGDTSAKLRYQVTLTRYKEGDALALRLDKFEFLEVGGQDARGPALRKDLREAMEAASALPTILVSPDGRFLDVVDIEAMIDKLVRSSKMPPKERANLTKTMKSPVMLATLKARSAEFWSVWVGIWAGADLEPGRTREIRVPTTLPNGAQVDRPVKVSHQGPAGPPGYVRLAFESTLEGGAMRAKTRAAVQGAAKDVAAAAGQSADAEIEGMEFSTGGEVITDPQTLKPAAARSYRRTLLKIKGQPPTSELEAHEYEFSWTDRLAKRDQGK
jgi:hypothetical protein